MFTWYSQEMGKINNIVIGIAATAVTLGILGKNDVFAQTNQLSKQKSEIPARINETQEQIAQIDGYDYQKMLYMDISLLSPDIVKRVMFDRINEIRNQYKLKPLKYDNRLHDAASDFAQEKNGTERRNEQYPHNNAKGWGTYRRIQETYPDLWKDITFIRRDNKLYGIKENIVSAQNSVYEQMQALINSSSHKEAILSTDINSVDFGFEKGFSVIVQLYANLK